MSFQQGVSGLNATSKSLEVIGNNIANANTFGSKIARAEFADVYANALGGGGNTTVGIGVNVAAVAQQFSQGNISTTDNPMDLAINGAVFFQVQEGSNPISYTRNGQFKVNRDGYIVNNAQARLVGYQADNNGVILPGTTSALRLPTIGVRPQATSSVDLEFNVDARQSITAPGTTPLIDFSDPSTFNNATGLTVYDAKGQDVVMTFFLQKSATDTWNVYATANGVSVAGTAGDPQPLSTLTFASDGSGPLSPTAPVAMDVPATVGSGGSDRLAITGILLDFGAATQFGTPFGPTNIGQNGFAPGLLTSITVEGNGIIMARYSNGQSKAAGQIELATFRNPQGLQPTGGNAWDSTFESGDPTRGEPGGGSRGLLQAGALEESNIDLTKQLVDMITAQRSYQANAQTIKTLDQVLQTLVNLR